VEVLQPLTVFCLAYLSYLAADVVGWSGIIALIGMYILHVYTVKKVNDFPVPSRDVTNQTLPGRKDFIYFRPGRVW
jgi:NhaP-type Na+/H+ or K+/H+ antiporter